METKGIWQYLLISSWESRNVKSLLNLHVKSPHRRAHDFWP